MGDWAETGRFMVFPWHCDHYGHMNVRWYAHFFDDAGFQLWSMHGPGLKRLVAETGLIAVVARTDTSFIHELTAGEMLVIQSGFTHVGTKSIRHTQRLYNVDTQALCAEQHSVEVMFDPATRKSAAMPELVRRTIGARLVTLD